MSWETVAHPEVCADCLMWIANRDDSGLDVLPTAEAEARREAVRYGARLLVAGWELFGDVQAEAEGDPATGPDGGDGRFSWQRCDGCGDGHGGDRYPVTLTGWRLPESRDDRAHLYPVDYCPSRGSGNHLPGTLHLGTFTEGSTAERVARAWATADPAGTVYVGTDGMSWLVPSPVH